AQDHPVRRPPAGDAADAIQSIVHVAAPQGQVYSLRGGDHGPEMGARIRERLSEPRRARAPRWVRDMSRQLIAGVRDARPTIAEVLEPVEPQHRIVAEAQAALPPRPLNSQRIAEP